MRTLVIICALLCAFPLIAGSEKKVVCYWNSFSVRNEGLKGMFAVKDIDPKICTHIIYTYLRFTASIIIFPDYSETDLQAFKNLKTQNPSVKLLIGVGGPRQGTQIPSKIASTPTDRNDFSQKVKKFTDDYGFDGCDFDWQWPGQGIGSSTSDKDNYVLMLQTLRNVLGTGKIFSISVAPRQEDIDKSYDLLKIHQYVDFINLNTYNFHGIEGETVTAFHSAYRKSPNDLTKEGEWNAVSVVENWLSKGVPAAKLTLGIPTYGRSFTIADIMQTGVGAPVSGLGLQSEYLIEFSNVIPYTEICTNLLTNPRWDSYWNSAQFAPYAVFNANQWVGFDDLQVVRSKVHLALNNDLGGLNYATIDRDDFVGNCTGTKFPLIKIGYDAMVNNILPPNPAETTTTTPRSTTTTSTTTTTTTKPTTTTSTTTTTTTKPTTTTSKPTTTTSKPTTTSTKSTTTTTQPPEFPPTTTAAVSKDPDTDEKSTTTEPVTTTVKPTTTEPTTIKPTTTEPTTAKPTTTSTTTKISTVPKTTVTRTTTTRTTTSENPTPRVTPGNINSISTTTKTSENELNTTPIATTEQQISSTEGSTTNQPTTSKILPATTTTKVPTPPVTPAVSLRTTQSTQASIQETEATVIVQQTTVRQNEPAAQTTSSRTTQYYIPTPPVTPKSKSKRSVESQDQIVCPEENGKFKNPNDCSSFFVCIKNVPYKFYCSYDKYYDELNSLCDHQLSLKC